MIKCICDGKHRVPALAVDIIIVNSKNLVLIKRASDPYKGMWALPGGFIKEGETLEEAAQREALEETNLKVDIKKTIDVYSDPKRDPRGHVFSITVAGITRGTPKPDTDAKEARWFNINDLPKLAFDHQEIINDYLNKERRN
ncbi:NUDIX hydrolase [Methanonatronarchaeum sp. AMET-Sl]|uniref:NUDIX hydrolase n=1 Tax=Methanonatronarchaeum sp. AMET-Sl TaxID=3037654 RepID=UPI00244DFC77|nr:NUDIX hydrolase [Methanonatronarchaeum sp. AMET-Sl]WGI17099.1 NUDIX hydrolase [Methanonatronarchaeum sp. AMET-Sl]